MSTKLEVREEKLEIRECSYQPLKSEEREKKRLKKKQAPKGGTLAGQKRKMEVNRRFLRKSNVKNRS